MRLWLVTQERSLVERQHGLEVEQGLLYFRQTYIIISQDMLEHYKKLQQKNPNAT